MDIVISQFLDMLWVVGDLAVVTFVSSPMIALAMTFLISLFIWRDWKIFFDALLLFGVLVVVISVTQQGMGLVDMTYHLVSSTPGLR